MKYQFVKGKNSTAITWGAANTMTRYRFNRCTPVTQSQTGLLTHR